MSYESLKAIICRYLTGRGGRSVTNQIFSSVAPKHLCAGVSVLFALYNGNCSIMEATETHCFLLFINCYLFVYFIINDTDVKYNDVTKHREEWEGLAVG